MSKTARLYKIESLIRQRGQVTMNELKKILEVSGATVRRDLEYLRSRLGAPIVWDALSRGYRHERDSRRTTHELPGMWFDERELYALLMAYQLLSELDEEGTLRRHLEPMLERIQHLLGSGSAPDAATLLERVRVVNSWRRPVAAEVFERVGDALVRRRRLALGYLTRTRGERGQREVSPQRLVHYRNAWYLDAWCHRAEDLRRFALDAMESAGVVESPAREVPLDELRERMDAGYGIYAGATRQWARLRFAPQAARWVGHERWHAEQEQTWHPDGGLELRVPYVNEQELAMDLLRHADEVTVIDPESLRSAMAAKLEAAWRRYRS
jgi:predicted DNA-binding transcriptional regulator YafY